MAGTQRNRQYAITQTCAYESTAAVGEADKADQAKSALSADKRKNYA
jgi:hypothetical protein